MRKMLSPILLFTLFVPWQANSSICHELFEASFNSRASEQKYSEVISLVQQKDGVFFKPTEYFSSKDKNFQKLVDLAMLLSSKERSSVIKLINGLSENNFRGGKFIIENPRFIFKLILQDQGTWDIFLKTSSENIFYTSNVILKRMQPIIEQFEVDFKIRLLENLGKQYFSLKKINTNWTGPKRLADGIMSHLYPPKDFFISSISSRESTAEVYGRYLKKINSLIRQRNEPQYNVNDIIYLAKLYQKKLKEGDNLIIVGSFPNGKAKIDTSDIDVFLENISYGKYFYEIDSAFNQYLLNQNKLNPRLESHSTPATFNLSELAIVSPIQIKVTTEQIDLLVYPPININRRDINLKNLSWPQPDVYPLSL